MENKEKFAFRKVKMSEGVEVEFIKLLTSLDTKSDEDIIFKLLIIDKKYYNYVNEDIKKIGDADAFILYYKKKIAEIDIFFEKIFNIK